MLNKKDIHIKNVLITSIIFVVFGLIIYNSKDALFGAPLNISSGINGTTLDSSFLPLKGNAKHAKELLINGRSVAFDRQGEFNDGVILSPGYNIVEVYLKDKFGNEKTKTYQVFLTSSSSVATTQGVITNNFYKKYGN